MSEIEVHLQPITVSMMSLPLHDKDQTGRLDSRANPCLPSLLPHLHLLIDQA
jgi:hypothetical protein